MDTKLALILLGFVVISSGCISNDVDQDPDQTAESYVYNLQSGDTEAAYNHLSEEVRNETGYEDFHSEITTRQSLNSQSGISLELLNTEVLEQSEGSATVEVTMEKNLQGVTGTQSTELELEETDIGAWELQRAWNPFELEDTDREEPDVGGDDEEDILR